MSNTTNQTFQGFTHDQLHTAYNAHVKHTEGHWKGAAHAIISACDAPLVKAAMNYMGSIVDQEFTTMDGRVVLGSKGYWAHGF